MGTTFTFLYLVHILLSVRWLFPQRAQTNNWGRFSEAATTGGPSSLHSPPNCLFFTKRTPRMSTTNASTTTTMSPPVPLRQQQERQYQWRQQQERERIKTKRQWGCHLWRGGPFKSLFKSLCCVCSPICRPMVSFYFFLQISHLYFGMFIICPTFILIWVPV